jgi:hypothetical protein
MYDRREDFRMFVQGDTIIGGQTWKKLYRDNTDDSIPIYEKAIREAEGRVYELRQGKAESLLFDFTLDIGDLYIPADGDGRYMEVIAIDTLISTEIPYRRLILLQHVNGIETDLCCWVEGIGSDCGIDLPTLWSDMDAKVVNHQGRHDYYWYLFMGCSYQNGECIFGHLDLEHETVKVNDISDTSLLNNNEEINKNNFYDLQGRRIQGEPQKKGVYIRGGRKYVKK